MHRRECIKMQQGAAWRNNIFATEIVTLVYCRRCESVVKRAVARGADRHQSFGGGSFGCSGSSNSFTLSFDWCCGALMPIGPKPCRYSFCHAWLCASEPGICRLALNLL